MSKQANIPVSAIVEIKNVPTELILCAVQQWLPCQKYAKDKRLSKNTNPFLKAFSVWLILKSETTSGVLLSYRQQLPHIAFKCKMSVRTLEKNIKYLKNEGLLQVDKMANRLVLESYDATRKYEINIDQREQTIYYDTNNDTALSEILVSIALMRFKERWMKMYWKKLNQNPDKYKMLYDLLVEFKADASRLHEPGYFRECHLELMLQSFNEEKPGHSDAFQILHEDIEANPDLNARADTLAFKLGYSAATSFCHLKFKLIKKGLISVTKDHIEGMQRARKDESIYHHRWLRDVKHTIWFRVDQITINAQNFYMPAP